MGNSKRTETRLHFCCYIRTLLFGALVLLRPRLHRGRRLGSIYSFLLVLVSTTEPALDVCKHNRNKELLKFGASHTLTARILIE